MKGIKVLANKITQWQHDSGYALTESLISKTDKHTTQTTKTLLVRRELL